MKVHKIIVLIALFFIFSCTTNRRHPVPYFSFDTMIDLNLPSYSNLQGIGGWAYVPVAELGSKGVIVYRQSQNYFVAFDRTSPADGGLDCPTGLEVDEENYLILNDPCSDAQFSLFDGSPIDGSSKYGLRAYETEFNGDSRVRIYNP